MKLSTTSSTSPTLNPWPTIAHQTVAQIIAEASLVPRQYDTAEYCRNYCAHCPKAWGLTKAKQASIWAFGGLFVLALGVAIGYVLRKCREQLILDRKETERRHAEQRVSNRDNTITALQATITTLNNDIKKAQKVKEKVPSSNLTTSNDAGPLNATPAEDKRKRKAKDNVTTTDPARDLTAVKMSPVEPAPKDETLVSGALQESSDPLPDKSLSVGMWSSSGRTREEQSSREQRPRMWVDERVKLSVRDTPPRPSRYL